MVKIENQPLDRDEGGVELVDLISGHLQGFLDRNYPLMSAWRALGQQLSYFENLENMLRPDFERTRNQAVGELMEHVQGFSEHPCVVGGTLVQVGVDMLDFSHKSDFDPATEVKGMFYVFKLPRIAELRDEESEGRPHIVYTLSLDPGNSRSLYDSWGVNQRRTFIDRFMNKGIDNQAYVFTLGNALSYPPFFGATIGGQGTSSYRVEELVLL